MKGKGRKRVGIFLAVSMLLSTVQPAVYAEEPLILDEGVAVSDSVGISAAEENMQEIGDLLSDGSEILTDGEAGNAGASDILIENMETLGEGTGNLPNSETAAESSGGDDAASTSDQTEETGETTDSTEACQHANTETRDLPATCTEPGYTGATVCVDCGAVIVPGTENADAPATGHTYQDGVCSVCQYECPHTGQEPQDKAATCVEAGYAGRIVCLECGFVISAGEELPAAGHNFVDGVCNVCGEAEHHYDEEGFCTDEGCGTIYQPAALNESGNYEIGNPGQLYWFAEKINSVADDENNMAADGYYYAGYNAVLTGDIVLQPEKNQFWETIISSVVYSGIFDGNQHTISGLECGSSESGFFNINAGTIQNLILKDTYFAGDIVGCICVENRGVIQNCSVVNVNTDAGNAGGICYRNSGTIQDCVVSGEIQTANGGAGIAYENCGMDAKAQIVRCENNAQVFSQRGIGGIAGICSYGVISDCKNHGVIAGTAYIGGICVGLQDEAAVSGCTNDGEVWIIYDSSIYEAHAGGIVGHLEMGCLVSDSDNQGNIQIARSSESESVNSIGYIGGVCGSVNVGKIIDCTNTGSVTGQSYTGGICGYAIGKEQLAPCSLDGETSGTASEDVIQNCINTGSVTVYDEANGSGEYFGGICGYVHEGSISGNTNYGDVTGNSYVAGIVGYLDGEIADCINAADAVVQNGANGGQYIAGVVGFIRNYDSNYNPNEILVTGCRNEGTVIGYEYVGGIVSKFEARRASFLDCENSGTVQGTNCVGGIEAGSSDGGAAPCALSLSEEDRADVQSNRSVLYKRCTNSGTVQGYANVGGVTGWGINDAQFLQCVNTGNVTGRVETYENESNYRGDKVGGIAGYVWENNYFEGCSNSGSVIGANAVGGICGYAERYSTFVNCQNLEGSSVGVSDVSNILNDRNGIGGILGGGSDSWFEDCSNAAPVTGAWGAGGIAGRLEREIILVDCSNSGAISGFEKVGGLVGEGSAYEAVQLSLTEEDDEDLNASGYKLFKRCINTGSVTGGNDVGGITGYSSGCSYIDCRNSAEVTGIVDSKTVDADTYYMDADVVGGITGYSENDETYQNCSNNGTVSGATMVGGITGSLSGGDITGCKNSGTIHCFVNADTNNGNLAGGIAGKIFYSSIEKCSNSGAVAGENDPDNPSSANSIGGIVGGMEGACRTVNSYNTGNISGVALIGGICGSDHADSLVACCYNTGSVTAAYVDPTAGRPLSGEILFVPGQKGKVLNCYYLTDGAEEGEDGTESSITGKNADTFASGKVAFLLNERQDTISLTLPKAYAAEDVTDNVQPVDVVWYQTIGTDTAPVLDPDHGVVYEIYQYTPECHPSDNYTVSYGNEDRNALVKANVELRNAKEATCTEDGYEGDYVCKVCGDILSSGKIIKAGHQQEIQGKVDPTCTEVGNTGTTICSVCGTVLEEGKEIPATGHNGTLQNAKEATCQEEGYTGDKVCSVCNEVLEKGTTIPIVDHEYVNNTCKWCGLITGDCGKDLKWYLTTAGVLTISGTGAMGEYSSSPWYSYRERVTSVIIDSGVTGISPDAFSCCTNLKEVTVAEGNTAYQSVDGVLFGKDEASLILYPQRKIGTAYEIPSQVTEVGPYAFYKSRLTAVILPENLQTIGTYAFSGSSLTSIVIPGSVRKMESHAFDWCNSLTEAVLSEGMTTTGDYTFYNCTQLTEATIPSTVTSVGSHLFYNSDLTSITIPKRVTEIGEWAFGLCDKLTEVTLSDTLETIGTYAFYRTGLKSIEIPDSVTSVGGYAFGSCASLNSVRLGTGITKISDGMFQNCDSLTIISVPSSVTVIGTNAFDSCDTLQAVRLGGSLTGIDWGAFKGCSALTDVYYMGDEATWHAIELGSNNDPLTGATMHYRESNCDKFGHEMRQGRMEPTCTESGYEDARFCSYCRMLDETYTPGAGIPATGHTEGTAVRENEVQGDCQNNGSYDQVVYCETCKEELSRETIDTGLGEHKYSCETTAATCTEEGAKVYTCSVCGNTYTEEIPALGHRFRLKEQTKAATCTEGGEDLYQCIRCDATETRTLPALGHSYTSEETKAATCTETGERTYTCGRCQDEYTTVLAALGHSYTSEETKAATCTETGERIYTCGRCGDEYTKTLAALGHAYAETVLQAPTCTERGENSYTCSRCEDTYTRTVPALGHRYESTTTATCTEAGITTYKCTVCGDTYTEETAALGHNYSSAVTKAATCTEAGERSYTCSRSECGDSFTRVIPAKGHHYTMTSTTATCTEAGTTVYTCSACQDSYEEESEALGHDYTSTVTKAATCTEKGERTYTCSRADCGDCYTSEIPALGHYYKQILSTADCTTEGKAVYECTRCQDRDYTTVKALGHDYEVTTTVTCTEDGIETGICKRCGDTYSESRKATGHDYQVETILTPATCTTDGSVIYACANCGDSYTDTIAATGHEYEYRVIQEATCTEAGEGIYTCKKCGSSYIGEIPATRHSYSYENIKEATCTEDGELRYTCYRCGDTYTGVSHAMGHSYVRAVKKAATCTEPGEATYVCRRCEDSYDAEIPAVNHIYQQDTVATAPTCTTEGSASYTCFLCGEHKTDLVPATGHRFVGKVTQEPTCSEPGILTYTCSVCGETYTRESAPLGHQFEGETTQAPTCTEPGIKTFTCKKCGKTAEGSVPATGHDYACEITKEPTCTEAGYGKYTCNRCSDSFEGEVKALGHDYEKTSEQPATCTKAGLEEYHCTRCEDSYTKAIPAKGHDYDCVTEEATCTESGSHTYTCKVCNAEYTTRIAALGHDYVAEVTKEATCTEDGERTYTCSRCGDAYMEVIPDGHQYLEVCTATCTEEGITTYTCGLCGYEYTELTPPLGHQTVVDEEIPATCCSKGLTEGSHCERCGEILVAQEEVVRGPHDWLEHHVLTAATCATEGVQYGVCRYCGTVAEEATPALNHPAQYRLTRKENYVEATSTADGSYDQVEYCRLCNEEVSRTPNVLHNMVQTEVVQEGSCEKAGISRFGCTNCDKKETRYVYGRHNWVQTKVTKDATCEEEGEAIYTCSICKKAETRTIEALKHRFTYTYDDTENEGYHSAVCTVCGYETTGGHVFENGACIYCRKEEATKYQIQVYINGTLDKIITAKKGQYVTVTADKTYRNKNFCYWTDDPQGTSVRSYSTRYTFYASRDESLYAVYAVTSIKPEPVLTIADVHSHTTGVKNYVYFSFGRDVPEGYTMLEHGVLYGSKASVFGAEGADLNELLMFADSDFTTLKNKVYKLEVTSNSSRNGTDYLDASVGSNLDGIVYARGYVIVTDNETEEKLAFLSPVTSASYNSANDISSKKCTISVVYNDAMTQRLEANYGETVTLSAKAYEFGNREFSYWSTDSEGKTILSYQEEYSYRVIGDVTIYAIYAVVLEPMPAFTVVPPSAYTSGAKNYIRFMFTRNVPDEFAMVEHGILYGSKASVFGAEGADVSELLQFADIKDLTLKQKVFKLEVTSNSSRVGSDYLDASVGANKDGIVYARGYVIVTNGQTGEKEIYYSSVISGSFNSFSETL